MKKKSRYPVHSQEVREQAIKLMDDFNFTPKQMSQKLNIPCKTVQSWKTKHHATLPREQLDSITETEKEVRRLQRQNAELEKENEFLKKCRRTLRRSPYGRKVRPYRTTPAAIFVDDDVCVGAERPSKRIQCLEAAA
jgi:transposase-like protein